MEEDDDEDINQRLLRRRQFLEDHGLFDSDGEEAETNDKDEREYDKYLDKEQAKGKLSLWIKEERTVRYIRRTFKKFLTSFKDEASKEE